MTVLLLFVGTLLTLMRCEFIYKFALVGFILSMIIILLAAIGLIDKEGYLEYLANEFLSLLSGVPIEEIETLEGTSHDKPGN